MKNRVIKYIQTLTLFLFIVGTSGCTQNNGYIGNLFGTWHLTSITSPSSKLYPLDDTKEYYIQFQGKVFCTKEVDVEAYKVINAYGSFVEQDETLTLDFKGEAIQLAETLGFGVSPVMLQLSFSGSSMILKDAEGKTWVFEKHG